MLKSLTHSRLRQAAAVALILANVLVAAVVLFRGRPLEDLLYIYWLETIIIAGMNILKLLVWSLFGTPVKTFGDLHDTAVRFFGMTLFLVFHVAGLAFMVMVPGFFLADLTPYYSYAALAFVASHGLSFALNFLGRGEFRTVKLWLLILHPYGRLLQLIAVLALALFVKFAMPVFFESRAFALLLVAGKLVVDLAGHWREHRRQMPPPLPKG
jgi:hypothetical protein